MRVPDVNRRSFVAALAAALVAPAAARSPAQPPYASRAEVRQFIDEVVAEHGFNRERVERWLNAARYSATVERLMQPPIPFGQRNWLEYRSRYLEDKRVQAGVDFWRSNAAALERATERYGVPPEVIVAIIGIETYWGRITGNFRTIDVLATLSFDYLRRSDYYRKELVELLLLAREQHTDPLRFKGSFAGAIGLPQFMPGSIRRFAFAGERGGWIALQKAPATSGAPVPADVPFAVAVNVSVPAPDTVQLNA
jgi:membrane-bound lytic murein transglycosylase B